MVNRIQEILEKYNLTAAKLADKLDVPRSTISHIFAERNKPSLEFIQKVLTAFPEINARWLVKGEGKIFEDEANLFFAAKGETIQKTASPADETSSSYRTEDSFDPTTHKGQNKYANVAEINYKGRTSENPDEQIIKEEKSTPEKQSKRIVKLIAIYNDRSFEEFNQYSE